MPNFRRGIDPLVSIADCLGCTNLFPCNLHFRTGLEDYSSRNRFAGSIRSAHRTGPATESDPVSATAASTSGADADDLDLLREGVVGEIGASVPLGTPDSPAASSAPLPVIERHKEAEYEKRGKFFELGGGSFPKWELLSMGYSARSAWTGLILAARLAGSHAAARVIITTATIDVEMATGSSGLSS